MKKIINLFVVFTILFATSNLFATAQIPDKLKYEGKTLKLYSTPLGPYLAKKFPKGTELFQSSCTACWRGYVATWEIKDDYLYLIKVVEGNCMNKAPEIPLKKIFPGKKAPIKATWFSGALRVPMGEEIHYEHMGFESQFEKDMLIAITEGKVIKKEIIDNRPNKR